LLIPRFVSCEPLAVIISLQLTKKHE
jgi:hypothetical protein